MPNYHFREVWTPLRWFQIRFYRDDADRLWMKKGKQRRRLVRKQGIETNET
ncbi:hypothetical protein [Paenibacillus sp. MMS20-IR301]|uniref:hypothetical protein n=1 Tax=Paenibacillus sp. MMS20-IR301 TaxID=2895946 RepID=UPI0028EA1114|nr:hypothetical protein [Paenibacillus sp. MMS20-IR301]WNS43538.1 hypothetical protein LOS79_32155 [Paenibacillus sp. MMS20-IR301]